MIVYIVTRGFDYEGEDIVDVFDTKEKAEQKVEYLKQQNSSGLLWGDFFNIHEFEVQ